MSVARADFSAWLASGRNSDVKLLIVIEDDGVPPAPKQRRCEPGEGEDAAARGARRGVVHREFAAHSVILEEACGWARAMLGSPESVESQERTLRVVVEDEAQAAAAELLVTALYAADPQAALTGADQPTLLQVLRLADRLQATRGVQAASAALAAAAPLNWDTATAVWALPAGCADNKAYAPAFQAAAATVQAELGDLEAALNDGPKKQRLLSLPFPGLLQLLGSDETRVASENTVFVACACWLQRHQGCSPEQTKQLAGCIRLHHCSRLFLPSVIGGAAWLTDDHPDWQRSVAYAHAPEALQKAMRDDFPALAAPRRPASSVECAELEWDCRFGDVAALRSEGATLTCPTTRYFAGYEWSLFIEAETTSSGASSVGFYLELATPAGAGPTFAARAISGANTELRALRGGGQGPIVEANFFPFPKGPGAAWGYADFFGVPLPTEPAHEAAWRNAGLVDERGHVRLRATVRNVL